MTITDTLETIFAMRGAETVVEGITRLSERLMAAAEANGALEEAEKGLEAAQAALLVPVTAMIAESKELTTDLISAVLTFGALAEAEGIAAAATGVLAAGLALLLSPLTAVVVGLATLTGGLLLAGKGVEAFGEQQATLARTALQLKNLPGSIPLKELTEFSDKMERLTGVNHNVITSLGATAAQFGLTKDQIEKAIPTVLDISAAKGIDPGEVLKRVLQASGGRKQGLIALGIDPNKIKGDLHDVNNLIDQIGKGFAGVAAGFRDTLPGSMQALKSSWDHMLESFGRFFGPAATRGLNLLADTFDRISAALDRIANFLHLPSGAELGKGGAGSDLALKGDPEQTAALKNIDANTKKTADGLVKNVLGGPGLVARAGFTARDMRISFGI